MRGAIKKGIVFFIVMALVGSVFLTPVENYAASKPKSMTLNATKMTMYVGDSFVLKVKSVKPRSASKTVYWKSSNTKVATVSSRGKITAKKAGNVTITAKSKKNKNLKRICKITVEDRYYSVTFKTCFGDLIAEQSVKRGCAAEDPEIPEIEGFEFYDWVPTFSKVYSDCC